MKFKDTLVMVSGFVMVVGATGCGEGPKRITLPGAVKPGVAKEVAWQVGVTSISTGGSPVVNLIAQDGGVVSAYRHYNLPTYFVSRLRADLSRDEAFEKNFADTHAKSPDFCKGPVVALREEVDGYVLLAGKRESDKVGNCEVKLSVTGEVMTAKTADIGGGAPSFVEMPKPVCADTGAAPAGGFEAVEFTRRDGQGAVVYRLKGCATADGGTAEQLVLQRVKYSADAKKAELVQQDLIEGTLALASGTALAIDEKARVWIATPEGDGFQARVISGETPFQRVDLTGGNPGFGTAYELKTLEDGQVYFAARMVQKTGGQGYYAQALVAALGVDLNGAPTAKVVTYDHMNPGREGERQAEAQSLLGVRDGVLYVGGFVLDAGDDKACVFKLTNLR
ncbi:MAG: hypothetical protein AB7P04_08110 [Bacteriovoracia bacterium]